ncbi:MAG TPA: tetratricopeptide repeat protein [Anaeromyxobacteraceae bacterium]|nr:tetratricopeptide repeat protein [Anaeromyxobacteraceae bacterium]
MTALLLALALATDPGACDPVQPAPTPDPAAASAYRQVGDEERAAGARETAVAAYRKAASLDPADAASRDALRELCSAGTAAPPDPFRVGLDLMERGDLRGAVREFEKARATRPDAAAALLQGICLYRLGDDDVAEPVLRVAEADPAVRDSARFYLGLLALRRGDSATAAPLFDGVVGNFGTVASDLALIARRSGVFTVSALASVGWNSNLTLAPSGFVSSGASDGNASIAASGLWRPMGESGPYVRVSGAYQQQFTLTAFDTGTGSGAVGWQLGHADKALVAEYAYSYTALGGSPYLSANRLLASGWLTWGSFTATATYVARFESYRSIYEPFSGALQQAEVRGAWWFGPFARLGVSYRLGVDGAKVDYLSWVEHGPHADFYAQFGRSVRLGLDAAVAFRTYGAVAPGPAVVRSDTLLTGSAVLEYDLGNHWAAQASLAAQRGWSNLAQYSYSAFIPTLGIAYLAGF